MLGISLLSSDFDTKIYYKFVFGQYKEDRAVFALSSSL